MERCRWLELSPNTDSRSEAKEELCGMNDLSERHRVRAYYFKRQIALRDAHVKMQCSAV